MDTFIVLAGGYWHQSVKPSMGGMQVDPNDGDAKRTVDYIVKVKGLPDHFLAPVEISRRKRFYCETCRRWITEDEIEGKTGCFVAKDHKVRMEFRDVEVWEPGAMDRYVIPKHKWISPCVRLFLNNSKGIDKWRDIWRYVEGSFPTTKRLKPDFLPVAVGNKNAWEITEEEVPVIDLSSAYEGSPTPADNLVLEWTTVKNWNKESITVADQQLFERAPEKPLAVDKEKDKVGNSQETTTIPVDYNTPTKCDVCGKECRGRVGMLSHKRRAHPGG